MKRMKKWTAVLLTFALTVLSCAMPEMTSRADALSGEMYVEEQQEGQNAAEKLEDGVSSEQRQPVVIKPNAGQGEEWLPVATDADATDPSQVPMVMSLLDLPAYSSYSFVLRRFPEVDITAVPLRFLLANLSFSALWSQHETIEVEEGESILVNLYEKGASEDEGYHLSDHFVRMELDDTLDLSVADENPNSEYILEILIGTGKQLDYRARRYQIRIFPYYQIKEKLKYSTLEYLSSDRRVKEIKSDILGDVDIPVTETTIYETWGPDANFQIHMQLESAISEASGDLGISVNAYYMSDFMKYYRGEVSSLEELTPISDSSGEVVISHNDYSSKFLPVDRNNPLESDNFLCIVYTDEFSGEVIGYEGIIVVEQKELIPHGTIYACDYADYDYNPYTSYDARFHIGDTSGAERHLYFGDVPNGMIIQYNEPSYVSSLNGSILRIKENTECRYSLYRSDDIEKVVTGWYTDLEGIQNAQDITDSVFSNKSFDGYKLDIQSAGEFRQDFTVLYTDGTIQPYTLCFEVEKETVEFSTDPIVNALDPWFRVTGLSNTNVWNGSTFENNADRTFDTLYGYGYQTVFLDEEADLTNIIPVFWTCSDDIKVYATSASGQRELQKSGETVVDFSKGPVLYTIIAGENQQKNYWVTFVKREEGSKLYVNYPSDVIGADENQRTIFLTDYFDNRHDILVANVGKEQLTGLKAELSADAKNVKLDEYWTLGGEGNDTLSGFDNERIGEDGAKYLAKVRLIPDGEGEISGTLTISADNQEPVRIRLTGVSSNPEIVGTELSDPVLYVPYSNVVATSNMLGTNIVTFSVEDGELPPGLGLNPRTGEISGVPTEMGTYTFSVKASYSRPEFLPSYAEITLDVRENTDENVYLSSTEGYNVKEHIGAQDGEYGFVLEKEGDQLFVSEGDFAEFSALYLNGEKLVEGTDYTKESGSTRMVIRDETFQTKARRGGQRNTIAAEFRKLTSLAEGGVGTDGVYEMNVTSQNFRIEEKTEEPSKPDDESSEGDTPKPDDESSEEDTPKPEDKPSEGDVPKPEDTPDYGNTGNSGSSVGNNTSSKAALVNPPLIYNGNMSLYSDSFWIEDETGWWYRLPDGTWPAEQWCYLPYRGAVEWYYFDENGYMATGWFTDTDGNRYYLSPVSDGLKGHMVTGWQQIDGEWYYFKEESDGSRGSLQTNTWIGEYYVNQNGIWKE